MDKRRLKFVIPIMVIVAVTAIFMLVNYYEEVPTSHKVLIVFSATIFSGFLAHGLFPHDQISKIDEKPAVHKKTKSMGK